MLAASTMGTMPCNSPEHEKASMPAASIIAAGGGAGSSKAAMTDIANLASLAGDSVGAGDVAGDPTAGNALISSGREDPATAAIIDAELRPWINPNCYADSRPAVTDLCGPNRVRGRDLYLRSSADWFPPGWSDMEMREPWQDTSRPRHERVALFVRHAMAQPALLMCPILRDDPFAHLYPTLKHLTKPHPSETRLFIQVVPDVLDQASFDLQCGKTGKPLPHADMWAPIYLERPCGLPLLPSNDDHDEFLLEKDRDGNVVGFEYNTPTFIGWAPYHYIGYCLLDNRHVININGVPYVAVYIDLKIEIWDNHKLSDFTFSVDFAALRKDGEAIQLMPTTMPEWDNWPKRDDGDGVDTVPDVNEAALHGWPAETPLLKEDNDCITPLLLPGDDDAGAVTGILGHLEFEFGPPACDCSDAVIQDSKLPIGARRSASVLRAIRNECAGTQYCMLVPTGDDWHGPRLAYKDEYTTLVNHACSCCRAAEAEFEGLTDGFNVPDETVIAPCYIEYPLPLCKTDDVNASCVMFYVWAPRVCIAHRFKNTEKPADDSKQRFRTILGGEYVRCQVKGAWAKQKHKSTASSTGLSDFFVDFERDLSDGKSDWVPFSKLGYHLSIAAGRIPDSPLMHAMLSGRVPMDDTAFLTAQGWAEQQALDRTKAGTRVQIDLQTLDAFRAMLGRMITGNDAAMKEGKRLTTSHSSPEYSILTVGTYLRWLVYTTHLSACYDRERKQLHTAQDTRLRINAALQMVITYCVQHIRQHSVPLSTFVILLLRQVFGLVEIERVRWYEGHPEDHHSSTDHHHATKYNGRWAAFPSNGTAVSKHLIANFNHFGDEGGFEAITHRFKAYGDDVDGADGGVAPTTPEMWVLVAILAKGCPFYTTTWADRNPELCQSGTDACKVLNSALRPEMPIAEKEMRLQVLKGLNDITNTQVRLLKQLDATRQLEQVALDVKAAAVAAKLQECIAQLPAASEAASSNGESSSASGAAPAEAAGAVEDNKSHPGTEVPAATAAAEPAGTAPKPVPIPTSPPSAPRKPDLVVNGRELYARTDPAWFPPNWASLWKMDPRPWQDTSRSNDERAALAVRSELSDPLQYVCALLPDDPYASLYKEVSGTKQCCMWGIGVGWDAAEKRNYFEELVIGEPIEPFNGCAPCYFERPHVPPGKIQLRKDVTVLILWAPLYSSCNGHDICLQHIMMIDGAPYGACYLDFRVYGLDEPIGISPIRKSHRFVPVTSELELPPVAEPVVYPDADAWPEGMSWPPAPAPLPVENGITSIPSPFMVYNGVNLTRYFDRRRVPAAWHDRERLKPWRDTTRNKRERAALYVRWLTSGRSGISWNVVIPPSKAKQYEGPRVAYKHSFNAIIRTTDKGADKELHAKQDAWTSLQYGADVPSDILAAPCYVEYPLSSLESVHVGKQTTVFHLWVPELFARSGLPDCQRWERARTMDIDGASFVRCVWTETVRESGSSEEGFSVDSVWGIDDGGVDMQLPVRDVPAASVGDSGSGEASTLDALQHGFTIRPMPVWIRGAQQLQLPPMCPCKKSGCVGCSGEKELLSVIERLSSATAAKPTIYGSDVHELLTTCIKAAVAKCYPTQNRQTFQRKISTAVLKTLCIYTGDTDGVSFHPSAFLHFVLMPILSMAMTISSTSDISRVGDNDSEDVEILNHHGGAPGKKGSALDSRVSATAENDSYVRTIAVLLSLQKHSRELDSESSARDGERGGFMYCAGLAFALFAACFDDDIFNCELNTPGVGFKIRGTALVITSAILRRYKGVIDSAITRQALQAKQAAEAREAALAELLAQESTAAVESSSAGASAASGKGGKSKKAGKGGQQKSNAKSAAVAATGAATVSTLAELPATGAPAETSSSAAPATAQDGVAKAAVPVAAPTPAPAVASLPIPAARDANITTTASNAHPATVAREHDAAIGIADGGDDESEWTSVSKGGVVVKPAASTLASVAAAGSIASASAATIAAPPSSYVAAPPAVPLASALQKSLAAPTRKPVTNAHTTTPSAPAAVTPTKAPAAVTSTAVASPISYAAIAAASRSATPSGVTASTAHKAASPADESGADADDEEGSTGDDGDVRREIVAGLFTGSGGTGRSTSVAVAAGSASTTHSWLDFGSAPLAADVADASKTNARLADAGVLTWAGAISDALDGESATGPADSTKRSVLDVEQHEQTLRSSTPAPAQLSMPAGASTAAAPSPAAPKPPVGAWAAIARGDKAVVATATPPAAAAPTPPKAATSKRKTAATVGAAAPKSAGGSVETVDTSTSPAQSSSAASVENGDSDDFLGTSSGPSSAFAAPATAAPGAVVAALGDAFAAASRASGQASAWSTLGSSLFVAPSTADEGAGYHASSAASAASADTSAWVPAVLSSAWFSNESGNHNASHGQQPGSGVALYGMADWVAVIGDHDVGDSVDDAARGGVAGERSITGGTETNLLPMFRSSTPTTLASDRRLAFKCFWGEDLAGGDATGASGTVASGRNTSSAGFEPFDGWGRQPNNAAARIDNTLPAATRSDAGAGDDWNWLTAEITSASAVTQGAVAPDVASASAAHVREQPHAQAAAAEVAELRSQVASLTASLAAKDSENASLRAQVAKLLKDRLQSERGHGGKRR